MGKVDCLDHRFQDRWTLEGFLTELRDDCVFLIWPETVAVWTEISRHANRYDKLAGSDHGETNNLKLLTSQQRDLTTACESNDNATTLMVVLMATNLLPRVDLSNTVLEIVENICAEKKQVFNIVCLALNNVA